MTVAIESYAKLELSLEKPIYESIVKKMQVGMSIEVLLCLLELELKILKQYRTKESTRNEALIVEQWLSYPEEKDTVKTAW